MTYSPAEAKRIHDQSCPGEITRDGNHIVLRLDHDAAEWLAGVLPDNDTFTGSLWWHVYDLKRHLLFGNHLQEEK